MDKCIILFAMGFLSVFLLSRAIERKGTYTWTSPLESREAVQRDRYSLNTEIQLTGDVVQDPDRHQISIDERK